MTAGRILVIIPCLNEEKSLPGLLNEISRLDIDLTALVVDDHSTDATYEVAAGANHRVRLLVNLGIGGAVQTGIKFAAANGFDFCIQIDGDGQHPPDQIAKLIAAQGPSGAAIVIGSRYLHNGRFRSTWARRLGSRIIGLTIGLLFRAPAIMDPTSGMRLMDRRAIDFFARRYPHDFPEPISLAWAVRSGLKVQECPVDMRAREHGRSSISILKSFAYMLRVLGYVMLARLKRTPIE
jgi:glycosyltransferase involved in cell wall biosynthesis